MTTKVYWTMGNRSLKQVRKHMNENDVEFIEQSLEKTPLTWDELVEVLVYTDNGVEDILSTKSKEYIRLLENGVSFEDMTLTEFHEMTIKYPKLIKTPIIVGKGTTLVGYNEDRMGMYKSQENRKKEMDEILEVQEWVEYEDLVV